MNLVYFAEHPIFEKEFIVYGQNEAFTRQLMQPALMDALLRFKQAYPTMAISLVDQQLYLGMVTATDFWKVDVREALTSPNFVNRLYHDLTYCSALLEALTDLTDQIIDPIKKSNTLLKPSRLPKSKDNPFLL